MSDTNENTLDSPAETQSGERVGLSSDDLLALYGEQMTRCLDKADTLDGMIKKLPQAANNVGEHKRLSIKAGVWRSVAHDMKNTLKIHLG